MNDMISLQDIVDEVDAPPGRMPGVRRIAVAGEFESGKSSVINAMLGRIVVLCNPGLTGCPFIMVNHDMRPRIVGETTRGRVIDVERLDELSGIGDLATCEFRIPVTGLPQIEIVEIPHHPGEEITRDDFAIMADADLIIWVMIASQAWRLSEKKTMEMLPPGSRSKSVLAVSRVDHLRDTRDLDKIEIRLQKEASPYFSEMVFMQASSRNLKESWSNEETWVATDGPSLCCIAREIASTDQGGAA